MDVAVIHHGLQKVVNRINAIEYSGVTGVNDVPGTICKRCLR
jgi:hypothetical protein